MKVSLNQKKISSNQINLFDLNKYPFDSKIFYLNETNVI